MSTERNAVLEEAARLADLTARRHEESEALSRSLTSATAWEHHMAKTSSRAIASAIRALKEQESTT